MAKEIWRVVRASGPIGWVPVVKTRRNRANGATLGALGPYRDRAKSQALADRLNSAERGQSE